MRWEGRNRGMADFNGRYNLPAVLRRAGMKTASISSFPDRPRSVVVQRWF